MRVRDYRARHALAPGETVRKVANNTIEHVDQTGRRRIVLHETAVLVYDKTGRYVRLYTGGWQSNTTKDRMNAYLPAGYGITQKDFTWYLKTPAHNWNKPLDFKDGGIIDLETGEWSTSDGIPSLDVERDDRVLSIGGVAMRGGY